VVFRWSLRPAFLKNRIFTYMKKYPIGIQSFQEIREGNYLYVDKTRYLHELIEQGKYYFLSRPRRFGKSLTVSTLKAIFEGKKELFGGLWIEERYDFSEEFPVVHLEFNNLGHREAGLIPALDYRLKEIGKQYGIGLDAPSPGLKFDQLIRALATRNKVVVLIDEYDKPVLDYLDDPEKAREARDVLKSFYAPLKSLDAHLRFVLLTGVSKFSRMSIFSELNNLYDLTMDGHYAALTGYTEAEVGEYFPEEIGLLAGKHSLGRQGAWQKVREWYNGYTWDGETKIYNPFSLLSLFQTKQFRNFWFHTGTPTFLVKLLNRSLPYGHEGVETSFAGVESFEVGDIAPLPLLFQTGYLTITRIEGAVITLDYPNNEVRQSLSEYLLTDLSGRSEGEAFPIVVGLARKLLEDDLEGFMGGIDALFARIPAEIFQKDREAYYQTVIYLAFVLMQVHVDCEPRQRKGRPDLIVHFDDRVYIMEFKLDEPAESALRQIREKGYADPYRNGAREVLLVGVGFSSGKKGVGDWKAEGL